MKQGLKNSYLVALFVLGCLLFNYPLLSLFNQASTIFGIPVLYAYLFAAWGILIALLALIIEGTSPADR